LEAEEWGVVADELEGIDLSEELDESASSSVVSMATVGKE
jgi:hypothetical protein